MSIVPTRDAATSASHDPPVHLLEARGVSKYFPVRGLGRKRGQSKRLRAVDCVNLVLNPGEIVGVVGETGSGKSTLGRMLTRLLTPSEGAVLFSGQDVQRFDGHELTAFRRAVQCVFQNPYSSLSPKRRIGRTIAEPLEYAGLSLSAGEMRQSVEDACESVGLPRALVERYPHELSGGQRQRVAIARAIVTNPACIVLDEPVSALDLSIQAQVLNLLADIHRMHSMAYVFIAHNLAVVRHFCDRVAVMYLGRIVEEAPRDEIFSRPLHPYTQALLSSVIVAGPEARTQTFPALGELPSPLSPPSGCLFHTRCPFAMDICREVAPEFGNVAPEHRVACHLHPAGAADGRALLGR